MGARGPAPQQNVRRRNKRTTAGTMKSQRPIRPASMTGEARAEWNRVVAYLEEVGAISQVDRSLLVRYCNAWQEWHELTELLKGSGRLVHGRGGELVRNPLFIIRREAELTLEALARELAVTPVARLRIGIVHTDEEGAAESRPDGVADFAAMRERLRG